MKRDRWTRGWRGALLVALGVYIGAILITPAVAHVGGTVGHLWRDHLRARVINLGDPRWVNTSEAAGGDLTGTHANLQIAPAAIRYADLGVSGWNFDSVSVANNTSGTVFAGCGAGQVAISGGASWDTPQAGTNITLSRPSFDGAGNAGSWRVDGHNSSGNTRTLVAHVLCINS